MAPVWIHSEADVHGALPVEKVEATQDPLTVTVVDRPRPVAALGDAAALRVFRSSYRQASRGDWIPVRKGNNIGPIRFSLPINGIR